MPQPTVAEYLVERLASLGVGHVFGIAGNYTAQFLTTAEKSGRLKCVGTTNELEAGYAADAYARIRPMGVACVTYGVGTFSLFNAIAGAFVERCPVVLLNGSASASKAEQLKKQGVLFAHAIDTLRTDEYVFRPITAATAVITDAEDAPSEIDRVLRASVQESLPVYLEVRDGVWTQRCRTPKPWSEVLDPAPSTEAERVARLKAETDTARAVETAVNDVLNRAKAAKSPVLWGGEWLQRRGLHDEFEELVAATQWAYTTTLLGKSLIAESNDHFIGVYDSAFAPADVCEVVENSDCLIALGTIMSDFYGGLVSAAYDRMVLASGDSVRVGRYVYPNVPLEHFVRELLRRARSAVSDEQTPPAGFQEVRDKRKAGRNISAALGAGDDRDAPLTWDVFFARMRRFVGKGMRVLVDTSLALFPAAELLIDERDHFLAQTAWLSIGYTTGGAVGASFADDARTVVLCGDGGFQMVPQVLSTLARFRKPAVIFVFNNSLYGIEQYLVRKEYYSTGATEPPEFFNELASWNYVKLAEAFGARGLRATTSSELEKALEEIAELTDVPALIEVMLDRKDLPAEIRATIPANASFGAAAEAPTVAAAAFN